MGLSISLERVEKPIAAVLLLVFLLLGIWAAKHDSVTVDEFMIVPSGLARFHDFGDANWINAFNPPLIQMAVALPAYLEGRQLPEALPEEAGLEYRWTLGQEFQQRNRDHYISTFFGARMVALLLGLGVGVVVFLWSRELFGVTGGLLSLTLYCFSPNLLSHAHLATIDMGFAALAVTSSYLLWRWVRGGWRFGSGMVFMAALAGALAAKFTAVFLVPVFAILSFVPLRSAKGPDGSDRPGKAIVGVWLTGALLVVVIVNSLFAWDGVGTSLGSMGFTSRTFQTVGSGPGAWIPSPVPEWYLKGMDAEKKRVEDRPNLFFYRGEVGREKHPTYFLHAMLLKTPITTLLLWAAALWIVFRGWRADYLHLLIPASLLLLLFSLVIGANLGLRYVLPVYPYLMILAGVLGPVVDRSRIARIAVTVLLLGGILSTAWAAPRFLSYFNLAAGGPIGGARTLSDSNVDWGQGLNDLRSCMKEEGIDQVFLSYFGMVDPKLYGVSSRPLRRVTKGGVIAISVHHLNGIAPFESLPEAFVRSLSDEEPLARAGNSIVLYRF